MYNIIKIKEGMYVYTVSKEIIWQPSKEQIENSKLTKFIQHCKLNNYDELEKKKFF